MISRRVSSGFVGVSANASGNGVLLQATEEHDGQCQQARTVLTPDEADEIAAMLTSRAAEVRNKQTTGGTNCPG